MHLAIIDIDIADVAPLIEGAVGLEQQGYTVLYLTSRPESMREATTLWIFQHSVAGACDLSAFNKRKLIMKPPDVRLNS